MKAGFIILKGIHIKIIDILNQDFIWIKLNKKLKIVIFILSKDLPKFAHMLH